MKTKAKKKGAGEPSAKPAKKPAAKKATKPAEPPIEKQIEPGDAKPKKSKATKKKWAPVFDRTMAKHEFSTAELAGYGTEIGRIDGEILTIDAELKEVTADFKARREVKATTRAALSQKLQNGYEMREVRAQVLFDTKAGEKKFVDPKDHKKVFKVEPMTHGDWQLPMFKAAEVVSEKPKDLTPPAGDKPQPVDLSPEVIEAAKAFDRVDLNIESAIGEGANPVMLTKQFKKGAKKAGWKPKISAEVAHAAFSRAEDGISAVAEFLKPYCIQAD